MDLDGHVQEMCQSSVHPQMLFVLKWDVIIIISSSKFVVLLLSL